MQSTVLKSFPVKLFDCVRRKKQHDSQSFKAACVCLFFRVYLRLWLWLYLVIAPQKACPPTLSMINCKAKKHAAHTHTDKIASPYVYLILIINWSLDSCIGSLFSRLSCSRFTWPKCEILMVEGVRSIRWSLNYHRHWLISHSASV